MTFVLSSKSIFRPQIPKLRTCCTRLASVSYRQLVITEKVKALFKQGLPFSLAMQKIVRESHFFQAKIYPLKKLEDKSFFVKKGMLIRQFHGNNAIRVFYGSVIACSFLNFINKFHAFNNLSPNSILFVQPRTSVIANEKLTVCAVNIHCSSHGTGAADMRFIRKLRPQQLTAAADT